MIQRKRPRDRQQYSVNRQGAGGGGGGGGGERLTAEGRGGMKNSEHRPVTVSSSQR